jgi:outer membrane protein TolC
MGGGRLNRAAWAAAVLVAVVGGGARARADADLTLDDAIRIARAHHPGIEGQQGQAGAAAGRREQALARLLPFVTGSLAYQPTTPNLAVTPAQARTLFIASGADTVVDTAGMPVIVTCRTPGVGNCAQLRLPPTSWALQNYWAARVGLSWTVWDWGRSLYGYRSARDLAQAQAIGVRTAARDVILQVRLAFFAALAADEQLVVAEDAVKTYQAHLAQTQGLHDAGLRTGIDVATAESAAATVAITLARTRAAREAARTQLAVALGEDQWHGWHLVADAGALEAEPADDNRAREPPDKLTNRAFGQRTELAQLQLEQRGLAASVASARGGYLPELTLSLDPVWAGPSLSSLTGNFTVTLAIGFPVGGMSPWLVHGQKREAEGNLTAARASDRAARDSIRQELLDARASFLSARDELRFARTLTAASARQRALAEGRYQTGVGNVIELYDALLTDVNARFQLVQARLDVASTRARLQHALGEDD